MATSVIVPGSLFLVPWAVRVLLTSSGTVPRQCYPDASAPIHPSSWKGRSPNFGCRVLRSSSIFCHIRSQARRGVRDEPPSVDEVSPWRGGVDGGDTRADGLRWWLGTGEGQGSPPARTGTSRAAPRRIPHGGVRALGLLHGRQGLVEHRNTVARLYRGGRGGAAGGGSLDKLRERRGSLRTRHEKRGGGSRRPGRLVPAPPLPQEGR